MKKRGFGGRIPTLLFLAFLSGLPPSGVEAQETSVLTLREVLAEARERNQRLRGSEALVDAAGAREPGAGWLPDPMLRVGAMNLTFPGLSATMPASMAPAIEAMQVIPFPGKLHLQGEIAKQATAAEQTAAAGVWWEVRVGAAAAFYRLFETDRRIGVMQKTLGLLRDFQQVANSMYGAGTGRQTDVLRANVETARMEAEIRQMEAMRRATAAALNAVLDRPADTPVGAPVLDPLPGSVPSQDTLRAWAVEGTPLLANMRIQLGTAALRRELAGKEIWPDFTVGLQYGLGRMGADRQGMAGAMVGFSIPVFAGKRQLKARDEAAAMERLAQADLNGGVAQVDAAIGAALAELDRARTLLDLYREEILPQAAAAVESSFSSYRVGAVDFLTLLDAQMAVNRFEGEYYSLMASYGTALAQLETTVGRELPFSDALPMEDR